MPSTHTSLRFHVVFSTKRRQPAIPAAWEVRLHEYLGGVIRELGGTPLQIGGIEDHVHLLFGLRPVLAIADVVREIKKGSTAWIHQSFDRRFLWQEGYGAFTVRSGNVSTVAQYIRMQREHHGVRSSG